MTGPPACDGDTASALSWRREHRPRVLAHALDGAVPPVVAALTRTEFAEITRRRAPELRASLPVHRSGVVAAATRGVVDVAPQADRRRAASARLERIACSCGSAHRDPLICSAGRPCGVTVDYLDTGVFVDDDRGGVRIISLRALREFAA